jgi:nucleoside-diphosphate-sugar epimerase
MSSEHVYLLFGKNGWIGGKLIELLTQQGKKVLFS